MRGAGTERALRLCAALLLLAALALPGAARAQYVLQPGDTVRFMVSGVPELSTDARIDIDGKVRLPHVEEIAAAGLTLDQLRRQVGASISQRPYRRFAADGQPVLIGLSERDVMVDVAAYRPIVVGGQVARPGPVEFRPGLTARAAVATAGGVGNPAEAPEPARVEELRSEADILARRVAELSVAHWRLQAELDGARGRSFDRETVRTVSDAELDGILDNHRARLDLALDTAEDNQEFLERAIRDAGRRLEVLEEQAENARALLEIEDREFERLSGLREQGLLPADRISEVRRAQLATQTRLLQTTDSIAQMNLNRTELQHELARQQNQRRNDLLRELAVTEQELEDARARLSAVQVGIMMAGGAVAPQAGAFEIGVAVTRGGETLEEVPLDAALQPGDVLTVSVVPPALP